MTTATTDRKALEGTYVADPTHSTFGFAVTYQGVSLFRGTLDEVEAQVVATEDGVSLDGAAKVESISIRSPQQFRDHVVYGDDFFAAGEHPEVRFSAASADLADDGKATVEGELTIKGISRPVTARGSWRPPVEAGFGITRAHLELEAVIDRTDFGLTWNMDLPGGGKALANDVTLSVDVALVDPATLPAE